MTAVRRSRTGKTGLAIVVAFVALFVLSSAHAATVKDVFESHHLLGTLAADCGKPASEATPYIVDRVIDADHVQLDRMIGRPAPQLTAIIDEIKESKANEIVMSYLAGNRRYTLTVRVDNERMRAMELTREDGEKQIVDGRYAAGGLGKGETPWFSKCLMRITIQNTPGGGMCIDVPASNFQPGRHLQMWDCNDTVSQAFTFDALDGQLSIANLCVEAGGGKGQQGDPIQLARCTEAPNQVWRTEAASDLYKFVGINNLCFDIPHYSKEHGAGLQLFRCHGESNQRFALATTLDFSIEEKTWREGGFLRDFDLTQADPKACQRSCIDDRQCAAWDYRKPEGRTNHMPHCWLVSKIKERKQGDPMTISGSVRAEAK
jgi:hypothetical protein